MRLEALLERFRDVSDREALVSDGGSESYGGLLDRVERLGADARLQGVTAGDCIGLACDFTPDSIAVFLALMGRGAAVALLPPGRPENGAHLRAIGACGCFEEDASGALAFRALTPEASAHPLLDRLAPGDGGFVVWSSGTAGVPKAVLHQAARFLGKFGEKGKALRTLAFLLFDHIAGLDTLFYTLTAGGALVLCRSRDPETVCATIERHRVEVLPTSPTFLRLLALSGAAEAFDLSSLGVVAYGSERMSESALAMIRQALPHVRLVQRFGTSEIGSPSSRSRADSTWVSLGGVGVDWEVREGVLWVKSEHAMLGYLNAPDPFDADGWYCTGDWVEREGEWLRFRGRESRIVNVGGEKVAPEEVVAVLEELPWVESAQVDGLPHALMGEVVRATLVVGERAPEDKALRREVRRHCRALLAPHKVPVKVELAESATIDPKARRLTPHRGEKNSG